MKKLFHCLLLFLISTSLFAQAPIETGAKLERLNNNVNSPAHEAHPVITPDGAILFFSRGKHPDNIGGRRAGSDIWYSEADSLGEWLPAKNIGAPLNNKGNNYVASIMPDGQTILLPNLYTGSGEPSNTPGLSISHKTSTGWSMPKKLEIEHYINKSSQGDFFLSSDGKVLIMAIEYFFTYGNEDLHVSFLQENGNWSQPMNIGNEINTKFEELSPYLAPDGVTLYFVSNGHGGFGSKDIFVTKRLDDTWKKWSKPVNLGASINSPGMETSFVVPASGKYAYLVSSQNSDSQSEIFRVPVPEPVRPEPVVLVTGKVFNAKTNQPIQANIKYEVLPSGKNVGKAGSDAKTGEYRIILPGAQKNYAYYAEAEGFLSVNENFDASDLSDYQEVKKDLYLTPISVGESITLKNVFFEKSTANILEESFPELDRMVKILKDNSSMEVEIGGHTDNVGKAELNVKLSEQRVETVKKYLVLKGIEEERIQGKGYGGSKPIYPNDSENNRQKNRRVEFKVLKR